MKLRVGVVARFRLGLRMERKSLTDLREEMRAVARGDSAAAPRPAPTTPFRMISTTGVLDLLNVLAVNRRRY